MSIELIKIKKSLVPPLIFVVLIWTVKLLEVVTGLRFIHFGIFPLHLNGLQGIITGPLIHDDWAHLYSNSVPLLVLGACLFYFYREVAVRVFLLIYAVTGLCIWTGAREAWHIGASGLVYGLASFIFLSGLLRRDLRLMAISMFVVFLYGSMVWGVFPELFPDKNISWEAHLFGGLTGMAIAIYYRKTGPPRKRYSWEDEDEEEVPEWYPEEKQGPLEKTGGDGQPGQSSTQQPTRINYIYKQKKEE